MPISDNTNYPVGHFDRVYEHFIKPACELAKFKPVRADDIINTNHIALDIIKRIIESDMALCDLSSRNPNVLYELGIRQAFNKPVTLIKDSKTKRIFDIQGFRDLEYDENLRIDKVQSSIENLARTISSTYEEDGKDINSLIKLLGIQAAKIEQRTEISTDTELILNSLASMEKRIATFEDKGFLSKDWLRRRSKQMREDLILEKENIIDDNNYLSFEEKMELKKGDKVYHIRFGEATVSKIEKNAKTPYDSKAEFVFEDGAKKLLLRFAKLRKVL